MVRWDTLIWLVVKPVSDNTEPVVNLPIVHLPVARSIWAICHLSKVDPAGAVIITRMG